MKDDKGFSLIELIIIMAIMSVLLAYGIFKSEVIFSYNAQEAYKKVLNTLATEKTQVLAHSTLASGTTAVFQNDGTLNSDVASKGVYFEFYVDGNSIYTKTYVKGVADSTKGKKVAGKGVAMICKVKDSASGAVMEVPVTGGEGNGVCFSYDRSTGAFLPYQAGKYVEEIHIIGGTREYVIRLMKKTGKAMRNGK
ncbi:MAG: prepilin-type N-terminal cleavage/methylation domain-containing protein [Lachnospiraceae bacterium]|nr:prepilin-type N-terminal cleavage/methylation domain-containing protein [Lachnospiraceae bacterium]